MPKFQSKYGLSALLVSDRKVINHLVMFQGFSELIYIEKKTISCFDPIFAVLDHFGPHGTLTPQFQRKYGLSALFEIDR